MNYAKIIVQWKEFQLPQVKPRDIKIDIEHDFIITISGPRRAGKTFICFILIKQLLSKGISKNNIVYINFEDEKLIGANADDLEKLLETFFEYTDVNKEQKTYLFLDEIQNVINWDIWVRRINELRKDISIIITGSSSKLLGNEISTKLRGRVLNFEVYPLSLRK